MSNLYRLRDFVVAATRAIDGEPPDEAAQLARIRPLLAELIAQDDWLPPDYAIPGPDYYRQYLLHADPLARLSVVSFVWGPGQRTPVHDHRVWGLVGVLRGAEISTSYFASPGGALIAGATERLERGDVTAVSPRLGDIHTVANAYDDRTSISIHVYGGNIGAVARAVFDPATGAQKPFISGYSNTAVPNLWSHGETGRRSS
ncbi:cysteine dioxygenase type I [Methylocella silvestris BL2]|uniref:Cysteine dioxygenase type I n=1 Tax=Methylocella silvestris (strain DSM 15510 / CIP 108128 / LMG 27833 / NCIMB 13906 / BL2) TaxID=395965 RepID=B8EQA6_METSB|nr:cysteine dioxygenase [Methylocella silvestris]ACK51596.1 cysteine dioxygenase type I [Methylocella silvestris BL2]